MLHQYVIWLVIVIFVSAFGFMFWSCYAHRKSVGHQAANFHQHLGVEIAWTAIPLIILVIIAWPVTKTVIAQIDSSMVVPVGTKVRVLITAADVVH
jgi:cytochrome c oxidase subunit 2